LIFIFIYGLVNDLVVMSSSGMMSNK